MGCGEGTQEPLPPRKRDNQLDPTNFSSVPTNESAKIRAALETTIVLILMNLFGTVGRADGFDPRGSITEIT